MDEQLDLIALLRMQVDMRKRLEFLEAEVLHLSREGTVLRVPFVRDGRGRQPFQTRTSDAGIDLVCCEDTVIPAEGYVDVPTGVKAAVPLGAWGLIIGRSSTFLKRGIFVMPGIIDPGYRGELFLFCISARRESILVKAGERLGQIVFIPKAEQTEMYEVARLPDPETTRGEQGFGSSGGLGDAGDG